MNEPQTDPIRVLVVDDEQGVLDVYAELLCPPRHEPGDAARVSLAALRSRLYPEQAPARRDARRAHFDLTCVSSAEMAVEAVRAALAAGAPFAVAFLDMRMPPGHDGAWAAEQIRALDEEVSLVLCSAYSDMDTEELCERIPPEDKFFFLAKPFHPQEVRQMALALGHKWRAERRIAQLAYYDTLTGLPNRTQFRTRFGDTLEGAQRHNRSLALLYIDLDNFKRINDTLGHTRGDELLQVTAERLRAAIRRSDEFLQLPAGKARGNDCARLGGDEFMALLPEVVSPTEAGLIADRIVKQLSKPMRLGGHDVTVTPSVGIAMYPQDGLDAETLLQHADLAMYAAKRQGPGTFAFYDAQMNAGAAHQLKLEMHLRGALANGELSLHFQPQFDLGTGQVSSVEALLRWTNPELGEVPPLEFIPMAEATGLILAIGAWVLDVACRQAQAWLAADLPVGRIAVNVSPLQFAQRDFVEQVALVLETTGLAPHHLELEITESLILKDEAWAYQVLKRLKALGIQLALDDFGTGYSSFGRLKDFPVDRLKIDRSFVSAPMSASVEDGAIVTAMISLAKTMGLGIVAEGVEAHDQLLFLQDKQCGHGQGFLLGSPLDAAGATGFLARIRDHGPDAAVLPAEPAAGRQTAGS